MTADERSPKPRFLNDIKEDTMKNNWTTTEMPKENGDYIVTIYDDYAGENINLHCRWDNLFGSKESKFIWEGKDITLYVIAWMKFPEPYDETHNPILCSAEDAWISQHM